MQWHRYLLLTGDDPCNQMQCLEPAHRHYENARKLYLKAQDIGRGSFSLKYLIRLDVSTTKGI
jgi:hypothetical protein